MDARMKEVDSLNKEFIISSNSTMLDMKLIHEFLTQSYWAKGISMEKVKRSIDHSLCFGLFHRNSQIGFARVVSDYVAIAYLADVFILKPYRAMGLGKQLVEHIVKDLRFKGIRRFLLATKDAHSFYEKLGFLPIKDSSRLMLLSRAMDSQ